MTIHPTGAFEALIPEDVSNRLKARRHLAAMDPERRNQLEAEWLAAEHHREPISDALRARAEKEWNDG